jgi:hypothetical protein
MTCVADAALTRCLTSRVESTFVINQHHACARARFEQHSATLVISVLVPPVGVASLPPSWEPSSLGDHHIVDADTPPPRPTPPPSSTSLSLSLSSLPHSTWFSAPCRPFDEQRSKPMRLAIGSFVEEYTNKVCRNLKKQHLRSQSHLQAHLCPQPVTSANAPCHALHRQHSWVHHSTV